MKRLIWSRSARQDLLTIASYYGQFDFDLPAQLLSRIEEAPLALLDYPGIGSPTGRRGVRKWRVRHTPFLLFYVAQHDRVEIRRVRHARTDDPDQQP